MSDTLIGNGTPQVLPARPDAVRVSAAVRPAARPTRPTSARCESGPYDALLWRLQSRQSEQSDSLTVGVIGCEDRTGVTTVAANLALRASELGMGPVLLVEADSQRPRIARAWRLEGGHGLTAALAGEATLSDCSCQGPAGDLHVVASNGRGAAEPEWNTEAVDALLAEARADYRFILVDLPPTDRLHGALLLARQLDEVLMVVRSERSRRQSVERAANRLAEDGIAVTGAVLNRRRSYLPRWLSRWR